METRSRGRPRSRRASAASASVGTDADGVERGAPRPDRGDPTGRGAGATRRAITRATMASTSSAPATAASDGLPSRTMRRSQKRRRKWPRERRSSSELRDRGHCSVISTVHVGHGLDVARLASVFSAGGVSDATTAASVPSDAEDAAEAVANGASARPAGRKQGSAIEPRTRNAAALLGQNVSRGKPKRDGVLRRAATPGVRAQSRRCGGQLGRGQPLRRGTATPRRRRLVASTAPTAGVRRIGTGTARTRRAAWAGKLGSVIPGASACRSTACR